jgi:FkbM family methyltransferase
MIINDVYRTYPSAMPKKGIIQVGAHKCEEKDYYNSLGITNVLWIEAQREWAESQGITHAVVSNVDDEEVDFIITNNSMSSSLLELKDHLISYPGVTEARRDRVKTVTLNTLFTRNGIPFDKYDALMMDVQGAELKVLQGANLILPHITSVYAEINLIELYKDCVLVGDLDIFLAERGFTREVTQLYGDSGWGDALYLRKQ